MIITKNNAYKMDITNRTSKKTTLPSSKTSKPAKMTTTMPIKEIKIIIKTTNMRVNLTITNTTIYLKIMKELNSSTMRMTISLMKQDMITITIKMKSMLRRTNTRKKIVVSSILRVHITLNIAMTQTSLIKIKDN